LKVRSLLIIIIFAQLANAAFGIEHLGAREVGIGGISSIADEYSSGLVMNPIGALFSEKLKLAVSHQNLFSSWASINGLNASVSNKLGSWTIGYLELSQQELNYHERLLNVGYAAKIKKLRLGIGAQFAEESHLCGGGVGHSLDLALQLDLNPRFKVGLLSTSIISNVEYDTGSIIAKPQITYLGSSFDISNDIKLFLEIVDTSAMRLGVEKRVGTSFAIRGGINEYSVPVFGFSLRKEKLGFEYALVLNEGGNSSLLNMVLHF